MKKHIPVMLWTVMAVLWSAGCSAFLSTSTPETDDAVGLPNPASVHCEEQGGRLEMRGDDVGTYGVCIFDDGSECEEWAYFRGECVPGETDTVKPSGNDASLVDTDWQLISLHGSPLLEDTHITIKFEESLLSGFAGCNHYGRIPDSSKYNTTAEGGLSIPAFAITVMDCPSPEGVMQQEKAYVDALIDAAAYRLTGEGLEIMDAAGETVLVYVQQAKAEMDPGDLLGTAWQLVSVDGASLDEGSSITLVFHNAHRVSRRTGCRDYVAIYEAEGDELAFVYTSRLGPFCAEEALIEEEEALGWTDRFRLSEGQLELLTTRGESLLFEPLPEEARAALKGPTWSLLAFVEPNPVEGMPAPLPLTTDVREGTEITINFEGDTLRGSAGCNSYEAAYTLDGSSLTIETIASTLMACENPKGVLEQEDRYLGVLRDVVAGHVYGGQLWLETGDGRALVFRASAAD